MAVVFVEFDKSHIYQSNLNFASLLFSELHTRFQSPAFFSLSTPWFLSDTFIGGTVIEAFCAIFLHPYFQFACYWYSMEEKRCNRQRQTINVSPPPHANEVTWPKKIIPGEDREVYVSSGCFESVICTPEYFFFPSSRISQLLYQIYFRRLSSCEYDKSYNSQYIRHRRQPGGWGGYCPSLKN